MGGAISGIVGDFIWGFYIFGGDLVVEIVQN